VHGRIIVPRIIREGAALIDLAHIFRWEVMKNRRVRVQKAWDERRKRRQGKGEGERPPAAPRGEGGQAA
jgi:hypothetical protein